MLLLNFYQRSLRFPRTMNGMKLWNYYYHIIMVDKRYCCIYRAILWFALLLAVATDPRTQRWHSYIYIYNMVSWTLWAIKRQIKIKNLYFLYTTYFKCLNIAISTIYIIYQASWGQPFLSCHLKGSSSCCCIVWSIICSHPGRTITSVFRSAAYFPRHIRNASLLLTR